MTPGVHQAPIKVLHLSPSLGLGGLEKLQLEFARYGDRDRFQLHFAALEYGGQTEEELKNNGCAVDVLNKPPGIRPRFVVKLANRIRRWGVDLLHTHNNGPLIYGPLAARLARVPVVVHTRHHGRFPNLSSREIAITTASTRLVDRVVYVSEDSKVQGRIDGIQAHRLQTIWNGIEVSRFVYHGPISNGPMITVARLRPEKNIDSLIRAVAIVARDNPDFQLELAGDGECEDSLKALTRELGLEDRVRFLGNVRDVPNLLRHASALILPSLSEGMSVSLLEAMAAGLPVIATHVGGNPEIVIHDETGLLVPVGDVPSLARAMQEIWRDPERGRLMGLAGRLRTEQYFDVRRMVADYETLYLDLLNRRVPGRIPHQSRTAPDPVPA